MATSSSCEVVVAVDRPHDERGAVDGGDQHRGAGRDRLAGAADREPALPGEAHVTGAVGTADAIERHDLLAHEAAVHTGRAGARRGGARGRRSPAAARAGCRRRPPRRRPAACSGEGVREGDGDDGGGEAADGGEEGVEGEVVQLDAEQHHSGDDPRDGQADTFFRRLSLRADVLTGTRARSATVEWRSRPREVRMKALQLTAWKHDPELREVPDPDPGPGQVVVRIGGAGACHSDLHLMHDFAEGACRGTRRSRSATRTPGGSTPSAPA